MTAFVADSRQRQALRHAAVAATLAPSIHDTQPWQLHLRADELELWADLSRQLAAADPMARQLTISVGAALLNARVALAAQGWAAVVERLPDPLRPDLVATVRTDRDRSGVDGELAALDPVLAWRPAEPAAGADALPDEVVAVLCRAAALEGAELVVVRSPEARRDVAALSRRAADIEDLDPVYRAELRARAGDDPAQRPDAAAVAAVLTAGDRPADWVRAGEALQRVLLHLALTGRSAGPSAVIAEVPAVRAGLRRRLAPAGWPQVLVVVGCAPSGAPLRRRHLAEVLIEEPAQEPGR